ncbi:hypothetical protein P3L10_021338 [Capsicum annuum]
MLMTLKTLLHFMNKFPLLEKLVIDSFNNIGDVEITSMPTVRNLILCNINVDDDGYVNDRDNEDTPWISFVDKFPLLEKLVIDSCGKLQNLHVSQQNLVSLVLKDSLVADEVKIDSPKLKSLEYKGVLTDFYGIEALQELEFVILYLDPLKLRDYRYSWLRDILESCAHSKRLSLICGIEEVIIFPVEMDDVLPVNGIKNLGLEIINCHATTEEISDDLIWLLPDLKTLSLTLGSITEVIEMDDLTKEDDVKVFSTEVLHNPKSDRRVCFLRI